MEQNNIIVNQIGLHNLVDESPN